MNATLVVWCSITSSFFALPYMYRTARQLCLLQVKVAVTRLWNFFSGETLM